MLYTSKERSDICSIKTLSKQVIKGFIQNMVIFKPRLKGRDFASIMIFFWEFFGKTGFIIEILVPLFSNDFFKGWGGSFFIGTRLL